MTTSKPLSTRIDADIYDSYQRHKDSIDLRELVEAALLKEINEVMSERESTTFWDQHGLSKKVKAILRSAPKDGNGTHCWMTPYQIAGRILSDHPDVFVAAGWPLGGRGCGSPHSWASYLGSSIVRLIEAGRLAHVEFSYLSHEALDAVRFIHPDPDEPAIESSATARSYPLSLFRYRKGGS